MATFCHSPNALKNQRARKLHLWLQEGEGKADYRSWSLSPSSCLARRPDNHCINAVVCVRTQVEDSSVQPNCCPVALIPLGFWGHRGCSSGPQGGAKLPPQGGSLGGRKWLPRSSPAGREGMGLIGRRAAGAALRVHGRLETEGGLFCTRDVMGDRCLSAPVRQQLSLSSLFLAAVLGSFS